ncbi:SDR family oxidoreductase [Labedella phragmitis]|uniref:SDR family oxidoreductase n=2 Tax=Labedella phragmitis TaxID=2498849 RepID=A0A444PXE3_9MICO|nr:SDR family oxidoreductase [Labedella phragmitis]
MRTEIMPSPTERIALVTGGSRGIGAAIVQRLAADGYTVAFTYVSSHTAADALVDTVRDAGGTAIAYQADGTDEEAFAAVVESVVNRAGGLDVLVNSAGGGTWSELTELPVAEIDSMIAINVRALVLATRAAIPHLREGGRIINIGSVNADYTGFVGGSVYSMTKGAVASFTKALARELVPRGLTVNNVQPGPVHTDANPSDGPAGETLRSRIAVERFGSPVEVAALVSYLTTPEAAFMTGASLNIDGGFSA